MAIKNKDGSEYRLSGPNPHMKNQLLWDHFELHNMNFEEIKGLIKKDQKIIKKETIKIEDEFKKEFEEKPLKIEKKIEEIQENKKQEIEEITEKSKKEISEESPDIKKVTIYCLPAKVEFSEDLLYGEVKKTINYGKKFKFEAIVIDNNDINFKIWTNAIVLDKESIIYPQNYEKRWWRVIETNKKFDGYIINCSPSNITPSFEDL